MAKLIDLRLNETIYWLTVVATIFLPLTFMTGFFGMNFGWMVGEIDTAAAFLAARRRRRRSCGTASDLVRDQTARDPGAARPGRARAAGHDRSAAHFAEPAAPPRRQMGQGRASQRCTAVQRHFGALPIRLLWLYQAD